MANTTREPDKTVYRIEGISGVATTLLKAGRAKIICFYGPMGSGKTTLIKALVKELGGEDPANSPTFGIVNEYHFKDGTVLGYHFDFYRLEDETEALDLGLEDYLTQDVWIFMEWPEKIDSLLPEDRLEAHLEVVDWETRSVSIRSRQ